MITEGDHERELLQATLQRFVEEEFYPHEELVDHTGEVPPDLGQQIEERGKAAGLYAANLPEKFGGGGLDYRSCALLERAFGKTSHALHSWVARPTEILLACTGDQIETYLKPAATGEKREVYALTEPDAGSDFMGIRTNARRDGDDWILNGSKHFISAPMMPDFAIVFAVTGSDDTPRGARKRITCFLVDVGTRGFDIQEGHRTTSYRGYKTFQLSFTDVRLGSGQMLGEEGKGVQLSGQLLGIGRIAIGATCCGKAERLFAYASDWAANRKQFGQPIGKFQGTGFKLADMAVEMRAADLLLADAVAKADAGTMTDMDAAMVKLYCTEMLGRVADNTVQIYGGMGLMEDLPIQRLWRDSRLERIWDGTSEIQRHIIARSILRPLGA